LRTNAYWYIIGNVTLGIKKPMKGMTLTITFTGTAEVDKYLITFIEISHELYTGGMLISSDGNQV
jgi:hypothetical protein